MNNRNSNASARSRQADTIIIDAPKSMTSMDVMHKFLSEFRRKGSRRLNTEIYETPAHAVMTGDSYDLKVWVAPEDEREGRFQIKYEIDGSGIAAARRSSFLRKIFRA